MKQNKIWEQLPGDLLHYLCSEWLTWSDLSVLDITCLGEEDREKWLSSLSSLVMTEAPSSLTKVVHGTDHNKKHMTSYYQWLGSRKVLVRDKFPVLLSVLEDLLLYCNPATFCPALHSIVMEEAGLFSFGIEIHNDYSLLESDLLSFLRHCNHLNEVNVLGPVRGSSSEGNEKGYARVDSVLYTTLLLVQANTLKKLRVLIRHSDELVCSEIENLLRKHMNSLQELEVYDDSDGPEYVGWNQVFNYLILSRHVLQRLDVWMQRVRSDNRMALLMEYLSLAGTSLKMLKFPDPWNNFTTSEELLTLIGTSCPMLESLSLDIYRLSYYVTKPSMIYHLCLNLKSFSAGRFKLEVDEKKNSVHLSITVCRCDPLVEDSMECLCFVLERGQYDQVGLSLSYLELTNDDEWSVVKSKVGGKLTYVSAAMSEDILVDLLKENPRLQVLKVDEKSSELSNQSLSTIAEYGQNLIELTIAMYGESHFTDEMISHMIRRCTKLEVLHIPNAGCESILCAAQYLPRLREVMFARVLGSRTAIGTLLDSEEVRWSPCLKEGGDEGLYSENEMRNEACIAKVGWMDGCHPKVVREIAARLLEVLSVGDYYFTSSTTKLPHIGGYNTVKADPMAITHFCCTEHLTHLLRAVLAIVFATGENPEKALVLKRTLLLGSLSPITASGSVNIQLPEGALDLGVGRGGGMEHGDRFRSVCKASASGHTHALI
eukprot:scaffold6281_cov207-Ochromonas_danica.AAC.3